ncbi:hypothetical protein ACIBCT_37230 [Streptosporangium sp. NPDC050855]|uniref:hypothetical protein n=1 Tax=Streptosporangium sp. NPDC050855 TaxID=3366194 RepID=UPI00378DB597
MSKATGRRVGKVAGTASAKRYRGKAVAGPGGVMTDEAGVITGDLTVAITVSGDQVQVQVQYTGAEEWYTLTGSPAPLAGRTGSAVKTAILRAIRAGLPEGLT